jgi:hypothetical protein
MTQALYAHMNNKRKKNGKRWGVILTKNSIAVVELTVTHSTL